MELLYHVVIPRIMLTCNFPEEQQHHGGRIRDYSHQEVHDQPAALQVAIERHGTGCDFDCFSLQAPDGRGCAAPWQGHRL